MSIRIGILGAGAIGGVIGAYLCRAGRDVTLIDMWPANVERIKTEGLTLTAVEEEFTVEARALHLGEVAAAQPEFDAVILSVKSYDTPWATMFIEPYLAPGGYVISAQNSINDDAIAAVLGWSKVMGCVVTMGAAILEPGRPQRTTARGERTSLTLGEPSGLITRRLKKMARVLSAVGPTATTTNLWGQRWSKLANNCMANAVAGITGLSSAGVKENPRTRDLGIGIAAELMRVAGALGVSVEPIWGIPANMFLDAAEDSHTREQVEAKLLEGAKALGDGRPSLAQDVQKGRRTEVDSLNGYVVRRGEELGVPTPMNQAVVELTRRVEAGELKPSVSILDWLEGT